MYLCFSVCKQKQTNKTLNSVSRLLPNARDRFLKYRGKALLQEYAHDMHIPWYLFSPSLVGSKTKTVAGTVLSSWSLPLVWLCCRLVACWEHVVGCHRMLGMHNSPHGFFCPVAFLRASFWVTLVEMQLFPPWVWGFLTTCYMDPKALPPCAPIPWEIFQSASWFFSVYSPDPWMSRNGKSIGPRPSREQNDLTVSSGIPLVILGPISSQIASLCFLVDSF